MTAPALLTETEAAKQLRISARTLRSYRRRGLIRYVAIGVRKIMYRPEDCDEFVESRVTREEPVRKQPPPKARQGGQVIPFSQRLSR
jgi:hypothetical protein